MKREQLLYYAIKYHGDYNKIRKAVKNAEIWKELQHSGKYITILDMDYPECFHYLKTPPLILFYKGDIDILKFPKVGIVGSRKICSYAREYTERISEILSERYAIVSGMAKGIDTIAHLAAMNNGKTIAVLGCGIDLCYPSVNQLLYREISDKHLLISEYPGSTQPQRYYFPFRNRLIAALGEFVIVTQASKKSGSMLTVNEALELGKDVYTIPYSLDNPHGEGCNHLLEQGAQIILSYEDLKSKLVDK